MVLTLQLTTAVCCCVVLVTGVTINSPPKIVGLGSEATDKPQPDIDDPVTLTREVPNIGVATTYKCEAENADDIEWKYKSDLSVASFGELPARMVQGNMATVGNRLVRSIVENKDNTVVKRPALAGYYQCVASNNFNFKAISPVIRLIWPDIPEDEEVARASGGQEKNPFELKCTAPGVEFSPPDYPSFFPPPYGWAIKDQSGATTTIEKNDPRRKTDPVSGSLYFLYLKSEDQQMISGENIGEYQCSVGYTSLKSQRLIGSSRLTVSANSVADEITRLYPPTNELAKVECIDGLPCKITCVFGGQALEGSDQKVLIERIGGTDAIVTDFATGIEIRKVTSGEAGQWRCSHPAAAADQAINIQLTVKSYPKLIGEFNSQYKSTGSEAEFVCLTRHAEPLDTKFYINGVPATNDVTNGVTINGNTLKFSSVKPEQTASITCHASNDLGSFFKTVDLVVFDAPTITESPKEGFRVLNSNITKITQFHFVCDITLDDKIGNPANGNLFAIKWLTTKKETVDGTVRDVQSEVNPGETGVSVQEARNGTTMVKTTLTLTLDTSTTIAFDDTKWQCQLEYQLPGQNSEDAKTLSSDNMPFVFTEKPSTPAPSAQFEDWWIIGVVGAVVFFVLLIFLIICCVRQNKGEQYYVDDKERKAGHDPEQEMSAYQFTDYKRPDQNPVKGSRASMNYSDGRPMESDNGSMEEYGDIDAGRFNEDGSFIGEYGQRQPRNQADV